jgi:hypothetical protein
MEARNNISGFEGSQAVPVRPSSGGKHMNGINFHMTLEGLYYSEM